MSILIIMTKYIKSRGGFGTTGTLSVIFVFLLLLGGGYFAYQYQKIKNTAEPIKKTTPIPPPPVSELAPPKTTPSEIDTSNWKTYRNEKYGFEVKYPKEWIAEEDFLKGLNEVGKEKVFSVNISEKKSNLLINIWAENSIKNFITSPERAKRIKIGEMLVIGYFFPDGYECNIIGGYCSPFFNTLIPHGGGLEYRIYGSAPERELLNIDMQGNIFNQILSTFKFIK